MASNDNRPPRGSQPAIPGNTKGQNAADSIVISDDEGQPNPPLSRPRPKPTGYVDLTEESDEIQIVNIRAVSKSNNAPASARRSLVQAWPESSAMRTPARRADTSTRDKTAAPIAANSQSLPGRPGVGGSPILASLEREPIRRRDHAVLPPSLPLGSVPRTQVPLQTASPAQSTRDQKVDISTSWEDEYPRPMQPPQKRNQEQPSFSSNFRTGDRDIVMLSEGGSQPGRMSSAAPLVINENRFSVPGPQESEPSSTRKFPTGIGPTDGNHPTTISSTEHSKDVDSSPDAMVQTLQFDTADFDICQAQVDTCLKKHLTTLHQLHALDVSKGLRRERLCYWRETRAKKRLGEDLPSTHVPTIPTKYLQTKSQFADMLSTQTTTLDSLSTHQDPGVLQISQIIEPRSARGKKTPLTTTHLSVPVTEFQCQAVQVPSYREYVHLRDNVITENDRILYSEPWFNDNVDIRKHKEDLWEEINRLYHLPNHHKPDRGLIIEQCRVYKPYVEAMLTDLNITWEDITFWLLADDEAIKQINAITGSLDISRFGSKLLQRSSFYKNKTRERHRWKELLRHLSKSSCRNIRLSAMLSSSLKKYSNFSIWHLVRESPMVADYKAAKGRPRNSSVQPTKEFQYRSRVCLICQEHDCLFHGEVTERAKITEEISKEETNNELDSSEIEADSETDSDIDKVINYQRTVASVKQQKHPDMAVESFGARWEPPKNVNEIYNRNPFYPCAHEGTCYEAKCRCYRENIVCEKACACPSTCSRRFRGCSCATKRRGQPCETGSATCECIAMNRECDAELCGNCGAVDVLDPVNRYDERVSRLCANVALQRNVPTKTYLGHSAVHGFGLYTGEPLNYNQFIGEYKGEVVTMEEANRRGAIYKHKMTNYLFDLNDRQETDSARAGNKLRFINHASDEHCNCYPRIVLCNGIARIGLFASKRIKVGTELYFNYHYDEEQMANFQEPASAPKKGSAFAVKTKATHGSLTEKEMAIKRRAQTEAARLAKLSKSSSSTATSSGRPSGMRATKSVASNPSMIHTRSKHRIGYSTSSGMVNRNSSKPMTKRQDIDTSSVSHFGLEIPESDNEDADYEESASEGEKGNRETDSSGSMEEDDDDDAEKRGRALRARPRLSFGGRSARRETRRTAAATVEKASTTSSSTANTLAETPGAASGRLGERQLINPNKAARKSVQMRPKGDTAGEPIKRKKFVITDDEDGDVEMGD